MTLSPLVSVIVPVYNVEAYLKRCVESILNQTYTNLEVIIVNDGSTDSSKVICKKFEELHNNIRLINQTNGGLSAARNTGLDNCNGDYIVFVDSDDWLKPQMIERLLGFALQHDLKLVECGVLNSRLSNSQVKKSNIPPFIENQSEAMYRLLMETNYSVWRRIYAKEVVEGLRFIPGKISEDVFFTIDCINKIEKQGCILDQLYIYNTENVSITRSPYNLKKIDAKDALRYPVSQTTAYGSSIKKRANYLLLRGLIFHYQRILLHAYLDKTHSYRKEFRKEVVNQLKVTNQLSVEHDVIWYKALLVKYTPIFIYKLFLQLNDARIKTKQ